MLKISIPCYNAENYIYSCISSIKQQTVGDYEAVIVNDSSTDNTFEVANKAIGNDSRFQIINSKRNLGALSSTVLAIENLNPNPDDILINIDGDDSLYLKSSLEIVINTYKRTNCMITYGSFKAQSGHNIMPNVGKRYPQDIINKRLYRRHEWLASHLRTYKYKLWRCIKDDDLRDTDGNYWRYAADLAIMYPLLEMSGDRQEAISDLIYFYRNDIYTNDHRLFREDQLKTAKLIRSKKPYDIL